jgi:octaprenyl-diphosphate synthase
MNLGIAFQLVDDALDYGGKSRQARQECRRRFPRGQDHPAGHAAFRRGTAEERAFWTAASKRLEIFAAARFACDALS